jgi:hypothetical protein
MPLYCPQRSFHHSEGSLNTPTAPCNPFLLRRALEVTDHNEEEDKLEKFLNGAPTPIFGTPL